jgi:hypothetical protein
MAEDLVVRRHFQADGKKCGHAERYSDPADTSRPSDSIEDLTKDCGTDQAAGEVTSEIDATGRAAVCSGCLAYESGCSRLSEKRSNAEAKSHVMVVLVVHHIAYKQDDRLVSQILPPMRGAAGLRPDITGFVHDRN